MELWQDPSRGNFKFKVPHAGLLLAGREEGEEARNGESGEASGTR